MRAKELLPLIAFMGAAILGPVSAQNSPQTIIDQWSQVRVPDPPALSPVTLDPATTALLILDMQNNLTNATAHPRGNAAVAHIKTLLTAARAHSMLVVYSNTNNATPADIVADLAPLPGDPVVKSTVDKFFRTDLEKILADKGIKTVIVTGTAANGAVLFTATGAAVRGLKVIVPVDGMPSDNPYVEQYVAWHLLNAPGTRAAATLSRSDLIGF